MALLWRESPIFRRAGFRSIASIFTALLRFPCWISLGCSQVGKWRHGANQSFYGTEVGPDKGRSRCEWVITGTDALKNGSSFICPQQRSPIDSILLDNRDKGSTSFGLSYKCNLQPASQPARRLAFNKASVLPRDYNFPQHVCSLEQGSLRHFTQ